MYVYIYTNIHVYVCIYIHIYIYTCEVYLVVLCVPFDLKGYLSQDLSKCIEQISKTGLALTARAQGVKTGHMSLCSQCVISDDSWISFKTL